MHVKPARLHVEACVESGDLRCCGWAVAVVRKASCKTSHYRLAVTPSNGCQVSKGDENYWMRGTIWKCLEHHVLCCYWCQMASYGDGVTCAWGHFLHLATVIKATWGQVTRCKIPQYATSHSLPASIWKAHVELIDNGRLPEHILYYYGYYAHTYSM